MENKLSFAGKIGNFVSNILLGDTKERIIRMDERMNHVNDKINSMSGVIDTVHTTLNDFRTSIATHGATIGALQVHTRYGISNSPTVPNDMGKKILKDSGFEMQYPLLKEKIFTLMDDMNLRTMYDYENAAFEVLKQLKDDIEMDPIKDYSVNNPGYPLELMFKVASWVIRDEYNEYRKS